MHQVNLWLAPDERSILFESSGATLWEAFGGFVIGCGSGVLVALITSRWTIVSEATMPFAIAANSVPIIAFAPIMNNWFGITNPASKMAIVAIIVFFPTMINTVRGLTLVDANQLQLMRSYAAAPGDILLKLRIPNALPYIFSAFRVASALSLIGAVVAEFFGGPRATLGVYITQQAAAFDFAKAWTAIMMASLIGITFLPGGALPGAAADALACVFPRGGLAVLFRSVRAWVIMWLITIATLNKVVDGGKSSCVEYLPY